jgi:predicted Zn-dependent protease
MNRTSPAPEIAAHVADRLHLPGPWEVFAERIRRYEIHFNGRAIELTRGPLALDGYGLRLFFTKDGHTQLGFQSSTDLSDAGVKSVVADAEGLSKHSDFPAKRVDLPTKGPGSHGDVEIVDRRLWERPAEALSEHVEHLLAAFDAKKHAVPSFGSVRATLTEASFANSVGFRFAYPHTTVDLELAVKAFGGPEGRPPGEYWVNESGRRLETSRVVGDVDRWCRFAEDVRRAVPPPTGEVPVVLPSSMISTILPIVIGSRFTGLGRLRGISPEAGSRIGASALTIRDDGRYPWGISSSPVDDEGVGHVGRTLIDHGAAKELLYNVLEAGAFDEVPTGNAVRGSAFGYRDWRRFLTPPGAGATTLVIEPGDGGSDDEVIEAAGDGVWVQQLGWAVPDPISGAFGGEIRIGYRIRNGKLAEPVRGGTMGGVVLAPEGSPSMLASVAAIGSRASLSESLSSPTLLIKNLTVAGA